MLPDIIFMDGGKGHVAVALEVLEAAGFDIPVVGMVKDDKHRTRALIYRKNLCKDPAEAALQKEEPVYEEIPLKGKPMLFRYIGRMQEEVHRFAIEYHRTLRNKHASGSVLDEIEGIGPVRRKALLEHFKSVERIRQASREELEAAPGMNARTAENVWTYFRIAKPRA